MTIIDIQDGELVFQEDIHLQKHLDKEKEEPEYFSKITFRFKTQQDLEDFNNILGMNKTDRLKKYTFQSNSTVDLLSLFGE